MIAVHVFLEPFGAGVIQETGQRVIVPGLEGDVAIWGRHEPLVIALREGHVRLVWDEKKTPLIWSIESGMAVVQSRPESGETEVHILTPSAHLVVDDAPESPRP